MKNAKTIEVCAKCSDMFSADLKDNSGKVLATYSGYVPGFFPDQHYGDYVMLNIDLNTGKILNWKPWSKAKRKTKQGGRK